MKFGLPDRGGVSIWLPIISGPMLSLAAFFSGYWFDPLGFKQLSAIPAFFFSIVALLIVQWLVTVVELQKAARNSDQLYSAIKNHIDVTPVGSPEEALRYVLSHMSSLREVRNTSFNIETSIERSDEKLYVTPVYENLLINILTYSQKGLIWKDIGDQSALLRFRTIAKPTARTSKPSNYKYKTILHTEPQLNFILLEHIDGTKEALFNWDFRGLGQDPTVLISRDVNIVEMFTKQFNLLWQYGANDHDNHATKSAQVK